MHVALSLDAGGLEQVVLQLIKQALALGQKASVLCLERPGLLAKQAEELGARVFCVNKPPGLTPRLVQDIEQVLRQEMPAVIHTHQIGALLYAGAAAKRAGISNVVHTEHGKHYQTSRRRQWMAWWAAKCARRFFCVSSDILREVERLKIAPRKKLAVIENGVEVAKFAAPCDTAAVRGGLGIPEGVLVVGTVGRLAAIKSQDVLLKGFAKIDKVGGRLPHLVLVGNGPLENELRALSRQLGVEDRVHFAGYQADPAPFFRIMDVFALTSSSEGMPLSILEAWAAAVPVVASRVGGLPELIEDEQTGLLFDAGNESMLAMKVSGLLGDREKRRTMGCTAHHLAASRFDVSVMAKNYHRAYEELLVRHTMRLPECSTNMPGVAA